MDREEWLKQQAELSKIEHGLRVDLDAARARYDLVKVEFDLATIHAQGIGLEHPDGTHLILKASKSYNDALEKYDGALNRFCDFILRGKLPHDAPSEP